MPSLTAACAEDTPEGGVGSCAPAAPASPRTDRTMTASIPLVYGLQKNRGAVIPPPLVGDGAGLADQNWNLTANWRLRGFQLGADDYIVKPFSPSQFLARVRRLLEKQP